MEAILQRRDDYRPTLDFDRVFLPRVVVNTDLPSDDKKSTTNIDNLKDYLTDDTLKLVNTYPYDPEEEAPSFNAASNESSRCSSPIDSPVMQRSKTTLNISHPYDQSINTRKISDFSDSTPSRQWSDYDISRFDSLLLKYQYETTFKIKAARISNEMGDSKTQRQIETRLRMIEMSNPVDIPKSPKKRKRNTVNSGLFKGVKSGGRLSGAQYLHIPSVTMKKDPESGRVSDEDDISEDKKNTKEYIELMNLKKLLKEKKMSEASFQAVHHGFKVSFF